MLAIHASEITVRDVLLAVGDSISFDKPSNSKKHTKEQKAVHGYILSLNTNVQAFLDATLSDIKQHKDFH